MSLKKYLEDPVIAECYWELRKAGPIRSVSLDITHTCNLRCKGCYYFEEGMERYGSNDDSLLDLWIKNEKARGTNFVTVVGGEPSLVLDRLQKLYREFKINVASNGLVKIPKEGFENMPIGIAVWGDHITDSWLRVGGKKDLFKKALYNYRYDERAFFYYTVAPGYAHEVPSVVKQCIDNGNKVLFNYYSDVSDLGGALDYRNGFDKVRDAIAGIIEQYPEHIYTTPYLNDIVTTGTLFGEKWGYSVCTNITADHSVNEGRVKNGNPFNPHFRAYNADFSTTRRCCTGIQRDCNSCFDTWEHFSWIMVHMRRHLASRETFVQWLITTYMFYIVNRFIVVDELDERLKALHSMVLQYCAQSKTC